MPSWPSGYGSCLVSSHSGVRVPQKAPLKNPLRPKDEQIRPSQVFLLGENWGLAKR